MNMKKIISILIFIIFCLCLCSCDDSVMNKNKQNDQYQTPKSGSTEQTDKGDSSDTLTMIDVELTVGNKVFKAKLYNNEATQALVKLFPLNIDMGELNGNEKYYYLSNTLKIESEQPGELHIGDIMLYGDNCLVVFYKNFSSSYQYTRLGYVEDAAGFAQVVTNSTTKVVFKLEKDKKENE